MQAPHEHELATDRVALALTRPIMKFGIPLPAAALIFAISAEFVIFGVVLFRDPLFGLVGVPLYGLARMRAREDARFIELLASAARTRWFNAPAKIWGVPTASPLPQRKRRHAG